MSEELLQSECIKWANNTYKELRFWGILHIPNASKSSNFFQYKSKALGIRKGFPDLQIILPNGNVFFVELKSKKGKQSPAQKKCHEWMMKRKLEYYLIDDLEVFKELIKSKMI